MSIQRPNPRQGTDAIRQTARELADEHTEPAPSRLDLRQFLAVAREVQRTTESAIRREGQH